MKNFSLRAWWSRLRASHEWLLLGLWVLIGGVLRFTQLTAKPPWTDEFATMVFSLGNHYQSVPLNQIIGLDTLLQPLQINPDAGISEVVSLVLNEDNHPPLYFALAHLWMKLFPASGDYISLWAARSLPAFLGTLAIPAIYLLGKITFRSRLVGQLSAAMMAVSPYAIFLSQEARHYSLGILFVIASLGCLMLAINYFYQGKLIPIWLILAWILINSLGLSVHYFFGLTVLIEAMTLVILLWHLLKPFLPASLRRSVTISSSYLLKNISRLALVFFSAIAVALAWVLLIIPRGYGNGMIDWIGNVTYDFLTFIGPPFQLLGAWITMLSLLPIESFSVVIVALSGVVMLLFFLWALPLLKWGFKRSWQNPDSYLETKILVTFLASAIALFIGSAYGLGFDITRGARYSFVYFPAFIALVSASLAMCWHKLDKRSRLLPTSHFFTKRVPLAWQSQGKITVAFIWTMGFLSALTVCFNLGYKKYYLPDYLASVIEQTASAPVLIATTHKSLVQTGEMMGIAWELKEKNLLPDTQFLLVHQDVKNPALATMTLEKAILNLPRPFEVWTVNFIEPVHLRDCLADSQSLPSINGYIYQRYSCLKEARGTRKTNI